jgi:hypothetical protein
MGEGRGVYSQKEGGKGYNFKEDGKFSSRIGSNPYLTITSHTYLQ